MCFLCVSWGLYADRPVYRRQHTPTVYRWISINRWFLNTGLIERICIVSNKGDFLQSLERSLLQGPKFFNLCPLSTIVLYKTIRNLVLFLKNMWLCNSSFIIPNIVTKTENLNSSKFVHSLKIQYIDIWLIIE